MSGGSAGPSLRARAVRRAFVTILEFQRARAGGVPDLEGPAEELEAFALELRNQVEELIEFLPTPRGMSHETDDRAPQSGDWVSAERDGVTAQQLAADVVPERMVLHLHGGAFLLGSPRTHRGLAGALSRTCRAPVFLPRYRLAPEHRFPAALDDAVAAYRWLTDDRGVDPSRLAVTGDSAGGGLALALLIRLRDEGAPLPGCYVGMSPWTDLAATGASLTELDGVDPWLSAELVLPAARAYAGEMPLDDPLISPVYADYAGLPPMLIHVGSDEILLDDARRVVERARAAGIEASVGVHEGMWHVFQAFPGLPESRWALREIGGFIRRHIGDVLSEGR